MKILINRHILFLACCFLFLLKATNTHASQNHILQLSYGKSVTEVVMLSVNGYSFDGHNIEITYTLIKGEEDNPDQIRINLNRPRSSMVVGQHRGSSYLFIFDKDRGAANLNELGISLDPKYDSGNVRRFFHTPESEDVLSLADSFNFGYASFQRSPLQNNNQNFIFLDLNPDLYERILNIVLRVYYGRSSTSIDGAFDPIRHLLRMPDDIFFDPVADCKDLLRPYKDRIFLAMPDFSYEKINTSRVSDLIKSNQVNLLYSTLDNVKKYQAQIGQLDEIKTELLIKEDVPEFCNELKENMLDKIHSVTEKKDDLEASRQRLSRRIELLEKCSQLVEGYRLSLQKKKADINRTHKNLEGLENRHVGLVDFLNNASDQDKALYNSVLREDLYEASASLDKLLQMQQNLDAMRQDLGSEGEPDCQTQISYKKQQIDIIEEQADKLITRYGDLQDLINEGMAITDPKRVKKIQELRGLYGPAFAEIDNKLQGVKASLVQLREEFQVRRDKESFTRRTRSAFKNKLELLLADLESTEQDFERLLRKLKTDVDKTLENDTYRSADIATTYVDSNQNTINSLSDKINRLRQDLSTAPLDERSYLMVLAGMLVMAILLFGFYVYSKALKKRRLKNKKHKTKGTNIENNSELDAQFSKQHKSAKIGGITIKPKYSDKNIQELANKGRGIAHAKAKEGVDYFMTDLGDVWKDTVVRKVYLNKNAIIKTYKFFYESCVAESKVLETGGYLTGFWDYNPEHPGCYDIALEDFIEPGDDAVRGEYQLNFGAKIGVRLDQTIKNYKEKTGKDMLLLAWFHSHPGMKIFLSNHDLALQNQLTNEVHRQKLLALVIDPNTQENDKMVFNTGIFSYRSNGLMNNNEGGMKLISWKTLYSWAIAPKTPSRDQFFRVNMETCFAKTTLHQLYFSDKSIIRFTLFLDEYFNQPQQTGYFAGKVVFDHYNNKRMAIITNFFHNASDQSTGVDNQLIGCFITGELPADNDWQKNNQHSKDMHFVMFCNNKEEGMLILTRQTPGVFNSAHQAKGRVSLSKFESWPTRRR